MNVGQFVNRGRPTASDPVDGFSSAPGCFDDARASTKMNKSPYHTRYPPMTRAHIMPAMINALIVDLTETYQQNGNLSEVIYAALPGIWSSIYGQTHETRLKILFYALYTLSDGGKVPGPIMDRAAMEALRRWSQVVAEMFLQELNDNEHITGITRKFLNNPENLPIKLKVSDIDDIIDRDLITREWYMYDTGNHHGINSSLLLFMRASEKQNFSPTLMLGLSFTDDVVSKLKEQYGSSKDPKRA
jgi:hypothetical protein